jgi:Glyoxalase-like domain
MALPRLRQVVLAATDLDAACAAIERSLGARDPFHDPGVGHFGLANAVYALGDTFLEVVSPVTEGTAAGRYLHRRGGDAGYMVMFEDADEAALRARLQSLDVRLVHDHSHADIVDLHLHPKDVPGAIVAVNVCMPEGSWRWGGPAWAGQIPDHGPGGIVGVTVAADDPAALATRWAGVLAIDVVEDGTAHSLGLTGQRVDVVAGDGDEGIVGVTVEGTLAAPVEICGVRFAPGRLQEEQ